MEADSSDDVVNSTALQDSCGNELPKFCDSEELFEGYGKECVASIKSNVKHRIPNSATGRKFFRSLIDIFSPVAAELLSENKIMDLLTDSYAGMNGNAICQLFLQLTQNILNSSHIFDVPNAVKEEFLQLQEFLTAHLKQEINEDLIENEFHTSDSFSSSLGILDLSNLSSIGNENYDSTCEQNASVQYDTTFYLHEIEELQHQNKKLTDENEVLKTQSTALEDTNHLLLLEKSKFEKQLQSLHNVEKEMKDLLSQHEVLKQGMAIVESSKNIACYKIEELEKEKDVLEENIKYLSEKLQFAQMESELKQKEVVVLKDSLVKSDLCKQNSLEDKQNIEIELIEKKLKCEELEFAINELMELNRSLRRDYGVIQSELEKAKANFGKQVEEYSNSSSFTESSSMPTVSFHHLITSTPAVDTSICAEMNNVVTCAESLPMPYCGKKYSRIQKNEKKAGASLGNIDGSPKANPCAVTRRKNLLKQMNTDHSHDTKIDCMECNSFVFNSKDAFQSGGDTTDKSLTSVKDDSLLASGLNGFWQFLWNEIASICTFAQNINSQAKSAFKIDLDFAQLEDKLLEAKGQSLELELNTKAVAGKSSMPPRSASDSDHGDAKRVSDSSSQVIRDQISVEIKALKTQLIRSHALLSYLQEKEKYSSTCFSPDVSSPLPRKSSGSQRGKLLQQKSLDAQTSSIFPQYSQKDSVSIESHRSTPLHITRSLSCPLLLNDPSAVCKSTQTDIAASRQTHQESQPCNDSSWTRTKGSRFSECSSTSEMSSKSADNLECGVCEVHPILEEPPSPHLPRHRTNSFLSAVSTPTNHSSSVDPARCGPRNKTEARRKSLQSRRVVKIAQQAEQDEKTKDSNQSAVIETKKLCPAEETLKSEKPFKTPQRSMRRGSGAGSPNSLTTIPRYPAFDLDEQDEERSLTTPVEIGSGDNTKPEEEVNTERTEKESTMLGKRESSKAMLMPEVAENSETESAKGSFECEGSQVVAELPVPDTAFPNLPNALLMKLGVAKNNLGDSFTDQEMESKFMTLSLAFKTDKMTLSKRLELHKRQRDIAEKDVDDEIKAIRDSLNYLNLNAASSETRDVIAKIQTHVDIVSLATSKVSARSETYGAVKQEERVSCAFEVMMQHVENLRRLFDKEHRELEDTKRILGGNTTKRVAINEGSSSLEEHHHHHKSLKTLGLAIGTVKSVFSLKAVFLTLKNVLKVVRRRASVADLHSLPGVSTFANWTAGIAVDAKSRRISALLPFTSSSSVGIPSARSVKSDLLDTRRCSLPASRTLPTPFEKKAHNDSQKISIAPTLSPVADEEPSEEEQDQVSLQVPELQLSSNTTHVILDNRRDSRRSSSRYFPFQDVADSSDDGHSEFSTERNESGAQSVWRLRRFWNTTSGLNLMRYCVSLTFAFSAFLVLVITFLPSDKCSANDEHVLPVLQTLERLVFKASRTAPRV